MPKDLGSSQSIEQPGLAGVLGIQGGRTQSAVGVRDMISDDEGRGQERSKTDDFQNLIPHQQKSNISVLVSTGYGVAPQKKQPIPHLLI